MTELAIGGLNALAHASEEAADAGAHGRSFADTAAHLEQTPEHAGRSETAAAKAKPAEQSWWDSAKSAVNSAAEAVDAGAHCLGNAANGLAEAGIARGTEAVRSVAGNSAANALHGAAEAVRDEAKQAVGFTYGVGAGATEAVGGMVEGTGDLVRTGAKIATDAKFRGQVVAGAETLAKHVAADPVGTAKSVGIGAVHAGKDWVSGAGRAAQEGNLGEYLGKGAGSAAVNIGSFFIPGADVAGAANVAGHLGEAANVAGHLGEAANAARHLGEAANEVSRGVELGSHAADAAGAVERTAVGAKRAAAAVEHAAGSGEHAVSGAERAVGITKRPADALEDTPAAKRARGTQAEGDDHPASAPSSAVETGEAPPKPALRERTFSSFDEFNTAANAAEPNTIYKYGNYAWKTDEHGRTIEASGKVRVHEFGRNDVKLQTAIGKEGKPTDIGFHLIADSLDGPTNRLNVVPGNGKPLGDGLKNLNQGDYKRFENALRNLANGSSKPVELRVRPEYDAHNLSNRPDRIVAEFRREGGIVWQKQSFVNK